MKAQPLVSIITVVYNGEKYLEQTILSVINQTYTNIEYLIIDGGSTDGTLDIIRKYEKHIAYWVSEPDKGLYDAMNKGIGLAKGELIGMINSDDWYEPNALEIVVNSCRQNPDKKIFHGDRFDILEDGTKHIKKFQASRFKFLYYGMTYNHPSMFIQKDIYKDQRYNIKLKALSDYEFVLKNFIHHPEFFLYIPMAYVNYRLDGISSKMNFKDAILEGYIARKNSGLKLYQNLLSIIPRTTSILIYKINSIL
jgi:glycosyltransferase involved in cell wall biosynthesis